VNKSTGGAAIPVEEKQVEEQQSVLDSAIRKTVDLVDMLEGRVDGVLLQACPFEAECPTTDREALVPVAERTRRNVDTISNVNSRLMDILERIQL